MSTGAQSAYSFDTKTPDLVDVLKAHSRSIMLDLHVSFPATVSFVQDNGAKVKVVPDIKDVLFTETGEQVQESLEISDIPVWTYGQGSVGGAFLQFPVRVGDKGFVYVSDRSIDGWYQNGLPAPAAGHHTHNMTDGYFVPGHRDMTRALSQDPSATVLEDTLIKLGKDANSEFAVLGVQLLSYLTELQVWLLAHVHPTPSGPSSVSVPPPPIPEITMLSNQVVIEE